MKRLFYLSGTLFFLSLTLLVGIHSGQRIALAQKNTTPTSPIAAYIPDWSELMGGINTQYNWSALLTENGDIYVLNPPPSGMERPVIMFRFGNIWGLLNEEE